MKKVLAMIFVLAMLVSSVAMAETIVVMPKLVGIPYFNASENCSVVCYRHSRLPKFFELVNKFFWLYDTVSQRIH